MCARVWSQQKTKCRNFAHGMHKFFSKTTKMKSLSAAVLLAALAIGARGDGHADGAVDNIYDAIEYATNPDLSTLLSILTNADVLTNGNVSAIVADLKSNQYNHTFLAPSNAALSSLLTKLGMSGPADLVATPYTPLLLANILSIHTLTEVVGEAKIKEEATFQTELSG